MGDDINALGVVRSLSLGGIHPHAFISRRPSPVGFSRFGIKHSCAALAGHELIAALVSFATQEAEQTRPVLFLTEERGVETVSRHLPLIQRHYRYTAPSVDILRSLMHKKAFQRLAENVGAPIPRCVPIESSTLPDSINALSFPVILKPAARDYSYAKTFAKAYRCENLEELSALVSRIAPVCSDLIVQEWVKGNDSDIYFCLAYISDNADNILTFVGRKLRSWPPRTGGTASCVACPELHAELSSRTVNFFRSVGFVGIGSMEFKHDRHTSEFYMIEPTVGRTDFQQEVATVSGVNIPLHVYRAELGLPRAASNYRDNPIIWQDRESVARARAREPDAGIDMNAPTVDALWRWDDPTPAIGMALMPVAKRLRAISRRMSSGSSWV